MKLVHFYYRLEVHSTNGQTLSINSLYKAHHQANIEMTTTFASDGNPSSTDFTIHGLSTESSDLIKANSTVDVYAGWYNSDNSEQKIAHCFSGVIRTVQPNYNNGGDITTQFTAQDGTSYDNIKSIKVKTIKYIRKRASGKTDNSLKSAHHQMALYRKSQEEAFKKWEKAKRAGGKHIKRGVSAAKRREMKKNLLAKKEKLGLTQARKNSAKAKKVAKQKKVVYKFMNFKKNTKALTIINAIAKKAGIKIHSIKLANNKVFRNGYNANKKPMLCIKQIAKDCNSSVYYRHGFLVIGKLNQNKKINYTASVETGLIQPPQLQTDSSQKNTYEVQVVFNPLITTGTTFKVKSNTISGEVIVLSGTSTYLADATPTTECSVQLLSTFNEVEAKKIAKEKRKEAKAKAKKAKDDKKKAQAKAKRKKRQKMKRAKKGVKA